MVLFIRVALLALIAGFLGGLSLGCSSCDAPDVHTYSCKPVSAGTPGCAGGPREGPDKPRPDADKIFPVGCVVQKPYCLEAYPGTVATCTCETVGTELEWICPV